MSKNVQTLSSLKSFFKICGVGKADDVLVHSSLSSLGYVLNGPNDVIDALLSIIGSKGTLLMPGHSGQVTNPTYWNKPAIPSKKVCELISHIRPFDKKTTPVRSRGVIASTFMLYPNLERSEHPISSILALGERAKFYCSSHPINQSEGIESPIGRLYLRNGKVLLIGVGLESCTALHLAEFIANVPYLSDKNNPEVLISDGKKNFYQRIEKYPKTSKYFGKILPLLRSLKLISEHSINSSKIVCFEIKPVIDLVVNELSINPYFLIEE